MAEPHPHLSLAGIPIRIEWSFWLIAVFLGYGARSGWLLAAWVAIVLVSILVHELGHAVALRIYHQRPRVVLHAFGGLTYGSSAYRSRAQSIVVSAAGPFTAFFLLGVPAYFLQDSIDLRTQYDFYVIAHDVAWVNIAWSIVNLLPILPLDGGNIAASLFGRPGARLLSMITAFGAATFFFEQQNQFAGFFLMLFAIMNFGSYQQEKAGSSPSVPTPDARSVRSRCRPDGATRRRRAIRSTRSSQALAGPDSGGAGRAGRRIRGSAFRAVEPRAGTATRALGPRVNAGRPAARAERRGRGRGGEPAEPSALRRLLPRVGRGRRARLRRRSRQPGADRVRDRVCGGPIGDNTRAMWWIDRAISDGFRAGALLDGEPDLAPLRIRPDWPAARARVQ